MKIVIVGGGKLGYSLAENLLEEKHEVHLIEKNREKCIHLANELDAEVIYGDGTEIEPLERADTQEAGCLIAVTGSDQDNLVAAQLAKKQFKIEKVIARANNPRNTNALRMLGADIAVSSTEIITNMIEQEVDSAEMHLLTTLNRGRAGICAMTLSHGAAVEGKTLNDISLPRETLIISIVRNETLIIPNGGTVLTAGDEIVAVCEGNSRKKLMKVLMEKG